MRLALAFFVGLATTGCFWGAPRYLPAEQAQKEWAKPAEDDRATRPPREGAAVVDFVAPSGEIWHVEAEDGTPLCRLPCTRALEPRQTVRLWHLPEQRDQAGRRVYETMKIEPDWAGTRRRARVVYSSTAGWIAAGAVLELLGSAGFVASLFARRPHDSDISDAGWIGLRAAGALVSADLALLGMAFIVDPPTFPSLEAEPSAPPTPKVHVRVSPGGLSGSF